MSGYLHFARYYDLLTDDVDYDARAGYFSRIIKNICPQAKLVLDLACGTGSLTYALAGMGYDMIGVDCSGEMLAAAMRKRRDEEAAILFLQQKAENLDLYGTVDACICALDSLNHLPGREALAKAFERVSLFLNPGGVFTFDMNTPYKHRFVLSDNAFVFDRMTVFCAWRNHYNEKLRRVEITLDFFEPDGYGKYTRSSEKFSEYAYTQECISELLAKSGLELIAIYEADTFHAPGPEAQRIVCVAQKRA